MAFRYSTRPTCASALNAQRSETVSGHGGGVMRRIILQAVGVALAIAPAVAIAQSPKAASYITDEEVKKVNAEPGVDRTIRVVDIGNENYAVGVIHRVATGARGTGAGGGGNAGAGGGGA